MCDSVCNNHWHLQQFSMSLLQGKVVCVTGASRGIGRATVVESVLQGAFGVTVHYYGDEDTSSEAAILQEEIQGLRPDCAVVLVPGDISAPETANLVRSTSNHCQ